MKLWITTLLLLCVATACESEPERAAYLTFSESGLSGSSCDGPCVPVIIDACVVSGPKQHIVIARMAGSSRDFPSTPNSCNPTPPDKYYASPYRKARMVVEETLFGKFKRGEEVEALFLGRWASSLSWQKDDHLFVVLRENQGEWFAYPSYTVELHSGDFQEGDGHDVGDVVFDFPSKISDLKAQLADVNQNYPTRCDYTPMTDAEFEYGVRHDNNCDFVGDDTQDIDDSGTDISGR